MARFTERLIIYLSPKTYLTTHLRPKTCHILKTLLSHVIGAFSCKLNMASMFTYMRQTPGITAETNEKSKTRLNLPPPTGLGAVVTND